MPKFGVCFYLNFLLCICNRNHRNSVVEHHVVFSIPQFTAWCGKILKDTETFHIVQLLSKMSTCGGQRRSIFHFLIGLNVYKRAGCYLGAVPLSLLSSLFSTTSESFSTIPRPSTQVGTLSSNLSFLKS